MLTVTEEHIKLLADGDETIFKAIFDSFYPRLVGLAVKYLGDLPASEDIVSDVFRKIWEKKALVSEVGSFESFMYTSVRNAVFNAVRNQKRHDEHHRKIMHDLTESGFDEVVIEENVHHRLYQAIEQLPEKGRQVFKLSVIHGLKDKEIAEDLGISVNTIKTHKLRALKLLREKLGRHYMFLFFHL